MNVLIAEDTATTRLALTAHLANWGFSVVGVEDGLKAFEYLSAAEEPLLVVLDWEMPEMNGPEVCSRIRSLPAALSHYIIMLTGRSEVHDIVAGLEAGANDYVHKPFEPAELRARVQVGARMLTLEAALASRVAELEQTLAEVRTLSGLLPMCAGCKKIRNDSGYWDEVEQYMMVHSELTFSHGLCPDCVETYYPDYADRLNKA
jgi:DNA-binding response OmpR family regulator